MHAIACNIANKLCHRLTSFQVQMAHGGPRGVRLQLYQWHQEWSLAYKVSDSGTTLSYGIASFCHHSLHFLFTSYLVHRSIEEAFDAGFLCLILGKDGEHRVHFVGCKAMQCQVDWYESLAMAEAPWSREDGQGKQAQDIMKDVTQRVLCYAKGHHWEQHLATVLLSSN